METDNVKMFCINGVVMLSTNVQLITSFHVKYVSCEIVHT